MDWLYICVAVVAVIITIIAAFMVKVPARIRWFRRGFFLVVAALFLAASVAFRLTLDAKITGYFIAVLLACFGLWRQGLTTWGVIAGLGATRAWSTITLIEISQEPKKGITVVEAYVGSIRVSRLKFNQPAEDIVNFLKVNAPNTKIKQV